MHEGRFHTCIYMYMYYACMMYHLSQLCATYYASSGTPWSVVWTSDGRQFFFDVTSHVSLWLMPEELKDNPQLHKILENSPDGNSRSHGNSVLFTVRV